MKRHIVTLSIAAIFAVSTAPAFAGWGSSGGSYGSSGGSWGSSGSSGSYGSWGSHGSSGGGYSYSSYGSSGGSSGGWYGSSGGSSGGYYGSSGGSSGGWYGSSGGSSGGWYGSSGGSSGGYYGGYDYGGAVAPPAGGGPPSPPPPPPVGEPKKAELRSNNAIELAVSVPQDAKVFVNDKATAATGSRRNYTTKNLDPTQTYTYAIRAEFQQNGQTISQTKTAKVSVGEVANVSFDPNEPVTTALTLKVPADAKVYLAGKETTLTGEVRKFTTTRLPIGQQWANYAIRVEVQREGQKVAKEEKVSLQAGDAREVAFDFSAPSVARVAER